MDFVECSPGLVRAAQMDVTLCFRDVWARESGIVREVTRLSAYWPTLLCASGVGMYTRTLSVRRACGRESLT